VLLKFFIVSQHGVAEGVVANTSGSVVVRVTPQGKHSARKALRKESTSARQERTPCARGNNLRVAGRRGKERKSKRRKGKNRKKKRETDRKAGFLPDRQ
jgi:antitoxin (DNA-binding transcriptional repressor) of toxin-antitoxin stability system